jgi:hypothetical protein
MAPNGEDMAKILAFLPLLIAFLSFFALDWQDCSDNKFVPLSTHLRQGNQT